MNPKIEQASLNRSAAYYGLCDKVVTLATGLLAVTTTFRSTLLSAPGGARDSWLLMTAWIALAISVVAGLLTHFGNVEAHTKAIKAMVAGNVGVGISSPFFVFTFWAMGVAIAAALIAFVAFAIVNTPLT